MKFGDLEIFVFNHGSFRLDGGAMFGSVPKNLWSRQHEADDENCIALATRSLIIKTKDRCFLVDAGFGDKWEEKQKQIFAMKLYSLENAPFDPREVTDVVITHLHFDHAGGVSRYKDKESKEAELCFPDAKHYLQKANLENAKNPNIKERASYLKENIEALAGADLELIDGSKEIFPGVSLHRVDGHTEGQQYLELESGGRKLYYPADLMPTSSHVPIPYHMGYDICAKTVLKEKAAFLEKALSEKALIVFEHDPAIEAGYIGQNDKGAYCLAKQVLLNFEGSAPPL